jgi:uncharacterized protein YjhX (UPF0386 family)
MNVASHADRIVHMLDGRVQRIETVADHNGRIASVDQLRAEVVQ